MIYILCDSCLPNIFPTLIGPKDVHIPYETLDPIELIVKLVKLLKYQWIPLLIPMFVDSIHMKYPTG